MTARSSSFLCPNFPNAPTSAAAFAQRLSSHRLSSQRSSPSCTIGIYPIGYRPSGSAPLQRQHCTSGRIAPVSSVTELREPPRAQKCPFCARGDWNWHRKERGLASGSITAETLTVNLAFLQITAHVLKIQMPHNQIINF